MVNDMLLDFDVVVEVFSLVIALLIAGFSFRAYFLTKQKRFTYFGLSFLAIALGLFFRALFNTYIQFEDLHVLMRGYVPVSYFLGFLLLLSMLFLLTGYMTMYIVHEQISNKKTIILLYLFVVLAVLASHDFYELYHVISFILVAFLFAYAQWNYKRMKTTSTKFIYYSFAALLVSELCLVFVIKDTQLYLIPYFVGNLFRIVAYILFLFALIVIFRKK